MYLVYTVHIIDTQKLNVTQIYCIDIYSLIYKCVRIDYRTKTFLNALYIIYHELYVFYTGIP